VVQGFGNVGAWTARLMQELGAKMVGVADAHGALAGPDGIDAEKLAQHVRDGGKVSEFDSGAEEMDPEDLVALEATSSSPRRSAG
jgi:glutamate dehydrogenase/leucine dehydrogenase